MLEYAIINPMPEVLKVLLEKIPDNLLLEVMKGNVKGIIEEGYGQCKESHFPMFFAITLEKQEHAAILLQYDKEHYERLQVRNIITNLVTQKVRELPFNLLLIALKHKLFEFAKILLESEWEILKLNDYRGKFYKDQLEGNCFVKGAHQLSSILGVYDKLTLEKLLKLCINCKVDISKVPVAVICDDGQEAKCTLFKYYFTNEKNILIKLLADNTEKLQQIASDPEVLASCNELLQKQCKEQEAIAKRL
ncbi:hypothetical protein [Candidatus Tisiphia endosymbiont of Beris chalybata]|uniref:hypothetical protein n=1 Tax=Candidatus Tisiphia endosymbiont of Beris chalybata TaxID=3066262 RepID=UPI00312CB74F